MRVIVPNAPCGLTDVTACIGTEISATTVVLDY